MNNPLITKIGILLAGVVMAFLLVIAFFWLFNLLLPFVIGLVLAAIANPLVRLLRRAHIPRTTASILSVILVIVIIGSLFYLLGSLLSNQIGSLFDTLEDLAKSGMNVFRQSYTTLHNKYPQIIQMDVDAFLQQVAPNISSAVSGGILPLGGSIFNFAKSIPGVAFLVIVSVISGFYLSIDFDRVLRWLRKNIRKRPITRLFAQNVRSSVGLGIGSWFKAQLIVMSALGVVACIGFWLLNYRHPIILGISLTLFDAMPILGAGMFITPLIIFRLIQGQWMAAFWHFVLYLAIVVTRQSIEPRVLGKQIGINPLITLLSIYVGLRLAGLWGVILGVIFIVIIMSILPKLKAVKKTIIEAENE